MADERTKDELLAEIAELRSRLDRVDRVEQALRNAEAMNNRILDAVPGGVVHVALDGGILLANEPAQSFLGLSFDSLSERYITSFRGETFRDDGAICPVEEYPVAKCLVTGEPQGPDVIGVRQPSGEIRWAVFYASPVPADEGGGAVVTFVDITERKRAETAQRKLQTQLAQAERLASVGTLAASIAHEVNNPLAYVLLNLRTIESRLDAAHPALRQLVSDAEVGASRIRDIVRELMTFARHSSGRDTLVDVNGAVRMAVKMAEHEIKHRARLRCQLGEIEPVAGSEGRLSQVFLNLLVNAARAIEGSPHDNEISVETRVDGRHVVVHVRDTGIGIAAADLSRLFEPFFSARPHDTGLGIGLAICRNIVDGHGGTIEVDSELGVGTTFTVRVPVVGDAAAVATSRASSPELPLPDAIRRLLVVDDDPLVRKAIASVLEKRKYEILLAGSCAEAFEILQRDDAFDIVLCDLMMLDGSGIDVYEWIQRERPALAGRVVFMSGGAFTARVSSFLSENEQLYLQKPFDVEQLDEIGRRLSS